MAAPSPNSAPPESFIGRTLGGRYRLVRLLGSGGMGSVYEAEQLDLRRLVAVKVMRGRFDAMDLARFRVEAETTARLGHPHIVTVIEFIDAAPEPALVMELLRGRSVSAALKQRPFSPEQATTIARQVLSALAAAHRSGVVHRDIKPANVFLVEGAAVPDLAKVLDFGVAKVADMEPLSAHDAMIGTPAFMAPEQVLRGLVDGRTDIYGVGGLLYAMLSGRPPVDTRAGMVAAITMPPAPLASLVRGLSPELAAIVHRALEKAPAARFESADEMASALGRLQGGISTAMGGPLGPPAHLPPPTAPTRISQQTASGPPSSPSGPPPSFSGPPSPASGPPASYAGPSQPFASTHPSPQMHGYGPPAPPMQLPVPTPTDQTLGSALGVAPSPRRSSPWIAVLLVALGLVTLAGVGLAVALVVVSRDATLLGTTGTATGVGSRAAAPDGSAPVAIAAPGDAGGRSNSDKSRSDGGSGRGATGLLLDGGTSRRDAGGATPVPTATATASGGGGGGGGGGGLPMHACQSDANCTQFGTEARCGMEAHVCECRAYALQCGTKCFEQKDENNCGRCGNRCSNDSYCGFWTNERAYRCIPCGETGALACGPHDCRYVNTDRMNCGGCNVVCPPGQGCNRGKCE